MSQMFKPLVQQKLFDPEKKLEEKREFIAKIYERNKAMLKRAPSPLQHPGALISSELQDISPQDRERYFNYQAEIRSYRSKVKNLGLEHEPLPKEGEEPFFFWLLDKLRTPQFALNNMILTMQEGDFNPWHITKSIGRAFTGEQQTEGYEIIQNIAGQALDDEGIAKYFLGFAWDLILDPLWLLGGVFGGYTKIGRIAEKVAELGGVTKTGKAVLASLPKGAKMGRGVLGEPGKVEDIQKMIGYLPRNVEGKLLEEVKVVKKESPLGKIITKFEREGRLSDIVKVEDTLDKIYRGQYGYFRVFGYSMLPKEVNATIFSKLDLVDKALRATAKKTIEANPRLKRYTTKMEGLARTAKTMFSTKSGNVAFDETVWHFSQLTNQMRTHWVNKAAKIYRQYLKGLKPDEVKYIQEAMESKVVEHEMAFLLKSEKFQQIIQDPVYKQYLSSIGFEGVEALPEDIMSIGKQVTEIYGGESGIYSRLIEAFKPFTPHPEKLINRPDLDSILAKLSDDGKHLYKTFVQDLEDMWKAETNAGAIIGYLDYYFPHVASPALQEMIDTHIPFYMAKSEIVHTAYKAAKKRKYLYYTLDDLEKMMMQKGGGEFIEELFIRDPSQLLAIRGAQSARSVASHEFLRETAMRFGKKTITESELNKGWRQVKGMTEMKEYARAGTAAEKRVKKEFIQWLKKEGLPYKEAGKYMYFPDEIASWLERNIALRSNPSELGKFTHALRTFTTWWKSWTLGVRSGYHARNMVTNWWNNWLAGVDSIDSYAVAATMQSKAWREWSFSPWYAEKIKRVASSPRGWKASELKASFWNKTMTDIAGKKWTFRQLMEEAQKNGVFSTGIYGMEVPRSIEELIGPGTWKTIGRRNKLVRAGFVVGTANENNARLAHFIHKIIKEGLRPDKAGMSVHKYLFDYSDITPVMKKMRDLFPFITWTRKNLPLQLEHLTKVPTKYSAIDKVGVALARGEKLDYDSVSDYIAAMLPLEMGTDPETGEASYFMLGNWLGASDLNDLRHPLEQAVQLVTPAVKLPIEIATNWNTFFETPIERYPGHKRRLFFWEVDPAITHTLRTVGLIGEIQRLTDPELELSSKISMMLGVRLMREKPGEVRLKRLRQYHKHLSQFLWYEKLRIKRRLIEDMEKEGA